MTEKYTFRRLDVTQAAEMFDLIVERIRWMDENGIRQWNATKYDQAYPLSTKEEACRKGTAYGLLNAEGRVVCAGILTEKDDFWPEDGAQAMYLHSFASRSDCPGAGAVFLRHAQEHARSLGKAYLRLDSQSDNNRLSRYYAAQGFETAGECEDGPYRGTLRQKKL